MNTNRIEEPRKPGKPTVVEGTITPETIRWPQRCPCCGGKPDMVVSREAAKTIRGVRGGIGVGEIQHFDVPYCKACLGDRSTSHRRPYFFFLIPTFPIAAVIALVFLHDHFAMARWPVLGVALAVSAVGLWAYINHRKETLAVDISVVSHVFTRFTFKDRDYALRFVEYNDPAFLKAHLRDTGETWDWEKETS